MHDATLPEGDRGGARYLAIAEAIAADIAAGRLKPGDRLPPQRDRARALGVTVGTVSRAYAEAERRGLVSGEVGRGTYVRAPAADLPGVAAEPGADAGGYVDLARNVPPVAGPAREAIARHLAEIAPDDVARLYAYGPTAGHARHREAGAAWIARRGLAADPAAVVVTSGVQNGLMLALSALVRPGETVIAEDLTYFGVRAVASLLRLHLVGAALDDDGLVPEALDAACRQHAPKALYVTPTFHNPTTATVPFDRRTRIAAICRRYGVAIVEDDVFGFLDESSVPLSALAPEISVYLTSMSKSVAGGLRAGFLHAPPAVVRRVLSSVHASAYSGAPMAAEIAARLAASGEALQAAAWHRRFAGRRHALALERLAGCAAVARPGAPQTWLKLPAGCAARDFVAAANAAGVGVMAGDAFFAGRAPCVEAVRIAQVAHPDDGAVAAALDKLAALWRAAARGAPLTGRHAA